LIAGFPGLLLDEPFSALDIAARRSLRETVRELVRETGVRALIVTHDPDDARSIAEQTILIEAGQVRWRGLTRDLVHRSDP
jgi:ABC-type thiamine transport system ATPase subunit